MHLQLLVPDAFWPSRDGDQVMRGASAVSLERLIARGRRTPGDAAFPEQWLLECFGITRQHDWPAAPWSLLGDGGTPGADAWMRCDPVHLRVDRAGITPCAAEPIEREEALALCATLNRHGGDRFAVEARRPDRWYLRLPGLPDIETIPTGVARGRPVDQRPPRGADALAWQSTLTEMQMLLHQHPVNQSRETRGLRSVNSVWLWGAGRLAPCGGRPFRLVAADDPLALGLATDSGAAATPLPRHAEALLESAGADGNVLAVLDTLRVPYADADAATWRERLAALESDWFAPLAGALRGGRIGMVTLHLTEPARTLRVEVTRGDLHRFWRGAKPLGTWRG